jgi:hypothetical protein
LPGRFAFALRLTACTTSRGVCHGRFVWSAVASPLTAGIVRWHSAVIKPLQVAEALVSGYNVQVAVATTHYLIISHEVAKTSMICRMMLHTLAPQARRMK